MASKFQEGLSFAGDITKYFSELINNILRPFMDLPTIYKVGLVLGFIFMSFWFAHFFREYKKRSELKAFLKKQRDIEIF